MLIFVKREASEVEWIMLNTLKVWASLCNNETSCVNCGTNNYLNHNSKKYVF